MDTACERLLAMRVSDVMARMVTELSPHQTMEEAADRLFKNRLSGAPVVDEMGRCVGILSATDFMKREAPAQSSNPLERGVDQGPDDCLHLGVVVDERVSRHMTTALQTISAEANLIEAARAMCANHVHRLPVLDTDGRVVGLISSLDLADALVTAFRE